MRRSAKALVVTAIAMAAASYAAKSQQPAPPGTDLTQFEERRYPQPVRVGDLLKRTVLQPSESRRVLGHVVDVVHLDNHRYGIVMSTGGFLGLGTRLILVPATAMVLLGDELEVLDIAPEQLKALPTYDDPREIRLGPQEMIRMGLAHPSH